MILKNLDNIDLDNFPVAIFGSGPAGITTALELEKKNIKSLIIEAGEEKYSKTSQTFYEGKIIGDQITDLSLMKFDLLSFRSKKTKLKKNKNFIWYLRYDD